MELAMKGESAGASPRERVTHAKTTGQVVRCRPGGTNYVDLKWVPLPGAGGGQWVKTYEDWDESRTCEETGVLYVIRMSEPAVEFVDEDVSRFAELRGSDHEQG